MKTRKHISSLFLLTSVTTRLGTILHIHEGLAFLLDSLKTAAHRRI